MFSHVSPVQRSHRMLIIGACFLCAYGASLRAQARTGTEREIALMPGPFPAIPRAALGSARTFENDIDSVECFPVHVSDRVLLWVARAHRTGTQLFVVPCDEMLTTQKMRTGVVYGASSSWWYRATLVDLHDQPRLALRRFAPAGWNLFSNAAVCGNRIAYWAMDPDKRGAPAQLVARIASLADGRTVASRPLGELVMETDNRSALERPVWNGACTTADFDATRHGRSRVRVDIR